MPLSDRLWPPGDVIMVPTRLPTWEQLTEKDCRWGRHSKACPAQVRGVKKRGSEGMNVPRTNFPYFIDWALGDSFVVVK